MMMYEIPDEHVLPCDFCCYHMRFRKGVKLETVRKAAERWLKSAMLQQPLDPDSIDNVRKMLDP
jgi:hypothetical protein